MAATNPYTSCTLCPRACGVNRLAGETGFCGETAALRVATAVIHRGEEPPLIGTGGSGTIFISGCNLGCVFCQNYQVSQGERRTAGNFVGGSSPALGKVVTFEEFAAICAALRDNGAENINIVTGSHAVPAIVESIITARKAGVTIPLLWNSSGYDSIDALEILRDHVDIFLPDLKTLDSKISAQFSNAPDYPDVVKAAILKMIEITNEKARLTKTNITKSSDDLFLNKVIIRHLILPGYLESTRTVLKWFADNAKGRALLSLMTQYTPIPDRDQSAQLKQDVKSTQCAPNRYVSQEEYDTVMKWLEEFEIEDGFCQELVTGNDWLPDFRRVNPFPSKLSVPVWSGN